MLAVKDNSISNNNKKLHIKKLRQISSFIICLLIAFVACVCFSTDKLAVTVSTENGEPIYFGNRSSNKIALMFNCYEGAEIILQISAELKKFDFCATFFFGGCFADDNPDLIKNLYNDGHEIGNHGYYHKSLGKLSYQNNVDEIKNTHDIILSMTGIDTTLFAPPSGDFSKTTLKACRDLGYVMIMWSKDTIDWLERTEECVYNKATKDISGGDFVLMHPFKHTLEALPRILDFYVKNNFCVSTVSSCIAE